MECPIPFPYTITQVRKNITCVEFDPELAALAGVKHRRYFLSDEKWIAASKWVSLAKARFHESWCDAHIPE